MPRRPGHRPSHPMQTAFELTRLMLEAQAVIGYRMLGLAGVWATPNTENARMMREKSDAFLAAGRAATGAAIAGSTPDAVLGAAIRPLRRRTTANVKRLSKLGLRGE